ncbi:membrane progestin receptor alpha-B-like [Liolophura sinensis]|uniref:membrane progestin receptor alpha-B-like n=1 Tax=Liolophura sinensis TaxID=3198878 RepID=UPI00315942FA
MLNLMVAVLYISDQNMKVMQESALLHYAKVFLVTKNQPTLSQDEVSLVFQEPGIKSGYRVPNRSWCYYLTSMFHVNNETVNIWSHLIGCIIMAYQLYSYACEHDFWTDDRRRVVNIFNMCCVVYTLLSAFAHTIHSKSDHIHYTSFQMDYGGVGLYTYATALVGFYVSCSDEVFYSSVEPFFLPLNTLLAWFSCFSCSLGKLFYSRPYPFKRKLWNLFSVGGHAVLCCFGSLKRYYNCFLDDECSMSSLQHHSVYPMFFFASIFFFSSHLPERLFPGRFDFVGHGHQLFHVFIVITSCLQLYAAESDLNHLNVNFVRTWPTWLHLIMSLAALLILDFLTILFLTPFVRQRIEKDKQH